MDGNGRWANPRGLPRTRGHEAGEAALLDVVAGAIEVGVTHLSAYAFSTENWKRSPDEVKFLMGFNRDVIRRRRDQLHEWGVRMRWVGRRPRLWGSVIKELEVAQELTRRNTGLTLYFCVNYGGRAEIGDAVQRLAEDVARGRLKPRSVDENTVARYLPEPDMPDVDLFVRSSGEQRTSNFLLWQSAYAEMVFQDRLWPDYDRRDLWAAVQSYVDRERRYGGAVDAAGGLRPGRRLACATAARVVELFPAVARRGGRPGRDPSARALGVEIAIAAGGRGSANHPAGRVAYVVLFSAARATGADHRARPLPPGGVGADRPRRRRVGGGAHLGRRVRRDRGRTTAARAIAGLPTSSRCPRRSSPLLAGNRAPGTVLCRGRAGRCRVPTSCSPARWRCWSLWTGR